MGEDGDDMGEDCGDVSEEGDGAPLRSGEASRLGPASLAQPHTAANRLAPSSRACLSLAFVRMRSMPADYQDSQASGRC